MEPQQPGGRNLIISPLLVALAHSAAVVSDLDLNVEAGGGEGGSGGYSPSAIAATFRPGSTGSYGDAALPTGRASHATSKPAEVPVITPSVGRGGAGEGVATGPSTHPTPFVVLEEVFSRGVLDTAARGHASHGVGQRIAASTLPLLHRAAHVITDAFRRGGAPRLTDWASTGGAYFVDDGAGSSIAVIKPEDEEPYAINNPKRHAATKEVTLVTGNGGGGPGCVVVGGPSPMHRPSASPPTVGGSSTSGGGIGRRGKKKRAGHVHGQGLPPTHPTGTPPGAADVGGGGMLPVQTYIKKGIYPGEGAAREVAAFLLDHDHHAGVPPTALVLARHDALHVSDKYRALVKQAKALRRNDLRRQGSASAVGGGCTAGPLPSTTSPTWSPGTPAAKGVEGARPVLMPALSLGSDDEVVGGGGGGGGGGGTTPSLPAASGGVTSSPAPAFHVCLVPFQPTAATPPALPPPPYPSATTCSCDSSPSDDGITIARRSPEVRDSGAGVGGDGAGVGADRGRSEGCSSCSVSSHVGGRGDEVGGHTASSTMKPGGSGGRTDAVTPSSEISLPSNAPLPFASSTAGLVQYALPPIKTASMQLYVPHACSAEDVSSSLWPVEEVHKLAILDIRLGNTDRNGDNILVRALFKDDPEWVNVEEEEAAEVAAVQERARLAQVAALGHHAAAAARQRSQRGLRPGSMATTTSLPSVASTDALEAVGEGSISTSVLPGTAAHIRGGDHEGDGSGDAHALGMRRDEGDQGEGDGDVEDDAEVEELEGAAMDAEEVLLRRGERKSVATKRRGIHAGGGGGPGGSAVRDGSGATKGKGRMRSKVVVPPASAVTTTAMATGRSRMQAGPGATMAAPSDTSDTVATPKKPVKTSSSGATSSPCWSDGVGTATGGGGGGPAGLPSPTAPAPQHPRCTPSASPRDRTGSCGVASGGGSRTDLDALVVGVDTLADPQPMPKLPTLLRYWRRQLHQRVPGQCLDPCKTAHGGCVVVDDIIQEAAAMAAAVTHTGRHRSVSFTQRRSASALSDTYYPGLASGSSGSPRAATTTSILADQSVCGGDSATQPMGHAFSLPRGITTGSAAADSVDNGGSPASLPPMVAPVPRRPTVAGVGTTTTHTLGSGALVAMDGPAARGTSNASGVSTGGADSGSEANSTFTDTTSPVLAAWAPAPPPTAAAGGGGRLAPSTTALHPSMPRSLLPDRDTYPQLGVALDTLEREHPMGLDLDDQTSDGASLTTSMTGSLGATPLLHPHGRVGATPEMHGTPHWSLTAPAMGVARKTVGPDTTPLLAHMATPTPSSSTQPLVVGDGAQSAPTASPTRAYIPPWKRRQMAEEAAARGGADTGAGDGAALPSTAPRTLDAFLASVETAAADTSLPPSWASPMLTATAPPAPSPSMVPPLVRTASFSDRPGGRNTPHASPTATPTTPSGMATLSRTMSAGVGGGAGGTPQGSPPPSSFSPVPGRTGSFHSVAGGGVLSTSSPRAASTTLGTLMNTNPVHRTGSLLHTSGAATPVSQAGTPRVASPPTSATSRDAFEAAPAVGPLTSASHGDSRGGGGGAMAALRSNPGSNGSLLSLAHSASSGSFTVAGGSGAGSATRSRMGSTSGAVLHGEVEVHAGMDSTASPVDGGVTTPSRRTAQPALVSPVVGRSTSVGAAAAVGGGGPLAVPLKVDTSAVPPRGFARNPDLFSSPAAAAGSSAATGGGGDGSGGLPVGRPPIPAAVARLRPPPVDGLPRSASHASNDTVSSGGGGGGGGGSVASSSRSGALPSYAAVAAASKEKESGSGTSSNATTGRSMGSGDTGGDSGRSDPWSGMVPGGVVMPEAPLAVTRASYSLLGATSSPGSSITPLPTHTSAASSSALTTTGRACDMPKGTSSVRRLREAVRLELIPIDHGLTLPAIGGLDEVACAWATWKQAHAPLSEDNRRYVQSLDGRADALMLHKILGDRIRPPCLLTLRVCTALLQQGVKAGLTLAEIGLMMVRKSGVGQLKHRDSDPVRDMFVYRGAGAAGTSGGGGGRDRSGSLASEGDDHDTSELSALEQAIRKAKSGVRRDKRAQLGRASREVLQTMHRCWQASLEASTTAVGGGMAAVGKRRGGSGKRPAVAPSSPPQGAVVATSPMLPPVCGATPGFGSWSAEVWRLVAEQLRAQPAAPPQEKLKPWNVPSKGGKRRKRHTTQFGFDRETQELVAALAMAAAEGTITTTATHPSPPAAVPAVAATATPPGTANGAAAGGTPTFAVGGTVVNPPAWLTPLLTSMAAPRGPVTPLHGGVSVGGQGHGEGGGKGGAPLSDTTAFMPYHDAIIKRFIEAIKPHIEAVKVQRQQRSAVAWD